MKILLFCILFTITYSIECSARETEDVDDPWLIRSFVDYNKAVTDICESSSVPWANYKNALTLRIIKPEYPELSGATIAKTWQQLVNDGITPEAKNRIQTELNTTPLGSSSLFSSVKLAGVQYRKIMDETYACAVLNSRSNILQTLRLQIEKNGSEMSEIRTKLKSAEDAMKKAKQLNWCKDTVIKGNDAKRELLDATMFQYCVYRHYLAYIETNLRENANTLILEENDSRKNLWVNSIALENTDQYVIIVRSLVSQIESEIARANDVYSQALVAYSEMERTYGIHILLLVLTDDYIQFRRNLKNFMNPLSQFFQKAVNVQSKNPPPTSY